MAAYKLSDQEIQILTTWLYEPDGYLDQAVSQLNVSARQALASEPALDVTAWIRSNGRGLGTLDSDWDECAMVWWLLAHDGQNITPQERPPEAAKWLEIFRRWDESIDLAFSRVPKVVRNSRSLAGIPAGDHLVSQQLAIDKAKAVLRQ